MEDGRSETGSGENARRFSYQLTVLSYRGRDAATRNSLPYMILSAPHRDAATAGAGCSLQSFRRLTVPRAT